MNHPLAARKHWRIAVLGLGIASGAISRAAPAAAPEPPPWRVLVLWGAQPDNPAAAVGVQALRSALIEGAAPRIVNIQSEVHDDLSFDAAEFEEELLALLRKKGYAGRLDLVMPMGGPALRFARRHEDELWPGVPIVAFGGSEKSLREGAAGADATGVAFEVDEPGTLRLARRLQPDAERLVLVAGDSGYDRSSVPRLERVAAREGAGLQVERLFGRPLRAMLDRVSHLPPRTIVLYTTVSRDADGQTLTPANVAELLSRASAAPVYGVWESQVGRGIVGGSVEGIAAHGRRAAEVALRVLRGSPARDIPIAPPSNAVPIVDWRQLRRFGLSESLLPPGSVVLNRPPSFVKEHRSLVTVVGLVLAVQMALIVALLAQARERRKAEADAAQGRADLTHAARLSAVGELTASIAHEINQPLGAILSNAEAAELFLEADPPRLDRVRQILGDIREEDRRASEVIREVRALARKQAPESTPLDVNAIVGDVMTLLAADARRRRIELQTDLASPLPLVSGDRTQLRQVVLNLALNGMEALGPHEPGARLVRIRTRADGSGVELAVSDTGPGLAADRLPRMFESFFTTKADGLGLGLSIVRSIVEGHGGRVTAENNAGAGATFRVVLPALRGSAPPRRKVG
jgi:signal transduction histidine kinase